MPSQLIVALGGSTVIGGSAPAAVIQANFRDDRFLIWLGTGTSPSAIGTVATIIPGTNYSSVVDAGPVPPWQISFVLGGLSAANALLVNNSVLVYTMTSHSITISNVSAGNYLPASLPASASGIGIIGRLDP